MSYSHGATSKAEDAQDSSGFSANTGVSNYTGNDAGAGKECVWIMKSRTKDEEELELEISCRSGTVIEAPSSILRTPGAKINTTSLVDMVNMSKETILVLEREYGVNLQGLRVHDAQTDKTISALPNQLTLWDGKNVQDMNFKCEEAWMPVSTIGDMLRIMRGLREISATNFDLNMENINQEELSFVTYSMHVASWAPTSRSYKISREVSENLADAASDIVDQGHVRPVNELAGSSGTIKNNRADCSFNGTASWRLTIQALCILAVTKHRGQRSAISALTSAWQVIRLGRTGDANWKTSRNPLAEEEPHWNLDQWSYLTDDASALRGVRLIDVPSSMEECSDFFRALGYRGNKKTEIALHASYRGSGANMLTMFAMASLFSWIGTISNQSPNIDLAYLDPPCS